MNFYKVENDLIKINFDYKPELVEAIKAFQGRKYIPESKTWVLPAKHLTNLDKLFKFYNFVHLKPEKEIELTNYKELDISIPENYDKIKSDLKLSLAKHQEIALSASLQQNSFGLLMEQRTGKTPTSIAYILYRMLFNGCKKTLIVAELTLLHNWYNEIFKWTDKLNPVIITGTREQRLDKFNQNNDVFLINYEALRLFTENYEDKKISKKWIKLLPELKQFDIIILDESHNIKNYSQKTKVALRLRDESKYRLILTGTAITQSAIDIYYQFDFLNQDYLGYYSINNFRNKHCIVGKFKEIKAYINLPELQEKIKKHSIRILRKDVIADLPDKIYEIRDIEITNHLLTQYNKLKEELILQLEESGETIKVTNFLVQLLRLAQVTSGHFIEGNNVNPKLEELINIIQNEDGKIVIWIKYIDSLRLILDRLVAEKIKSTFICGEIEAKERINRINQFNTIQDIKVIVIQIQTGKVGIDLSEANTVIYYENDYSYGLRSQSEDRTQTIFKDKKDNVNYIDLIMRIEGLKSIDEFIFDILKKKKEISDILIDDIKKNLLKK